MRPIPELPAHAALVASDGSHAAIQVVDVSVGGLALAKTGALDLVEAGRRLSLHVDLGRYGAHDVGVEVRWAAEALVGVQYVDLAPAATTAVRRYVAELLERGAHS
jgi:hypothetical protein